MIKGGYKIVNFNGAALSGTPETLAGIYDQIVDDYDKPVMVSGVSLNGDIMDDAYAGVQEKVSGGLSKSVELTVYGGIITVTEDDEVSFVLSKTTAELTAEIGDLEDLETTEKDSLVGAVNELTNHTTGESVDLESYNTASNKYTFPSDGYVKLKTGTTIGQSIAVDISGMDLILRCSIADTASYTLCPVRKGMTVFVNNIQGTGGYVRFTPLV